MTALTKADVAAVRKPAEDTMNLASLRRWVEQLT